MLLGVDVGGTFTDAVLVSGGAVHTAKALSTPRDQSVGVMAAIDAVLEAAGAPARAVEGFAHGMTVATNALLQGTVARTALVATAGFCDVIELGRQARRELYRLCAAHPAPLTPPERRFAARERTTPDGVLAPLEDVDALADAVAAAEPEAVAVCLLHAYRHPAHERAIGAALRERLDVHVSLSHDVVGTFREYERAATTEVDAALSPLLARYLYALRDAAAAAELPPPSIMQSSGGLADLQTAAEHAALTVLSGPAGGAAAAALLAERCGEPDLVCFDMGGTSCDVCVVEGGRVREATHREVGGRPLALPAVDIHTVGAGGGSVGWRDPGGALRVGPRSAGADPGPACYRRGGTEPTVTDAAVVLGWIDPGYFLGGLLALDADASRGVLAQIAEPLGMSIEEAAYAALTIATENVIGAIREITIAQGIDPREYSLIAGGGASGLNVVPIARELGSRRVLLPSTAGALSACGALFSNVISEFSRSRYAETRTLDADAVSAASTLAQAQSALSYARSVAGVIANLIEKNS
ncbi:MAG: hydantoinase/oxoprolinase family protein [Solirubrobacteraceae bacterium]